MSCTHKALTEELFCSKCEETLSIDAAVVWGVAKLACMHASQLESLTVWYDDLLKLAEQASIHLPNIGEASDSFTARMLEMFPMKITGNVDRGSIKNLVFE